MQAGKYTEAEYFQFRQADPAFSIILSQQRDVPMTIDNTNGMLYFSKKNGIGYAFTQKCLLLRSFFSEERTDELNAIGCVKGLDFYNGCLYAWTDSELLTIKENKIINREAMSVKKCKQKYILLTDGTLKCQDKSVCENVTDFDTNGEACAYITDSLIKLDNKGDTKEWQVADVTSICLIDSETVIVGTSEQVLLLAPDSMIDFGDPTNAYSGTDSHYLFASLPSWGPGQPIKHLIVVAHTRAADLSLIAKLADDSWSILSPTADDALAQLPFSRVGSDDQSPRQLFIDYTNAAEAPSPVADGALLPPAPMIWVLTNEGTLCPFWLVNSALPDRMHPLMMPIAKEYTTEEIEEFKSMLAEQVEQLDNSDKNEDPANITLPETTSEESEMKAQSGKKDTQEAPLIEPKAQKSSEETIATLQIPEPKTEAVEPATKSVEPKIEAVEQKEVLTSVETHKFSVNVEYQVRKEYAGYENNMSQLFCQLYLGIQQDLEQNYHKLQDLEAFTEQCRHELATLSISPSESSSDALVKQQLEAVKNLKGECLAALVTLRNKEMGAEVEKSFSELESIVKDADLYASLGGRSKSMLSLYQQTIRERSQRFSRLLSSSHEATVSIVPPAPANIQPRTCVPLRKLSSLSKKQYYEEEAVEVTTSPISSSITIGYSPQIEGEQKPAAIPMSKIPPVEVKNEKKSFTLELESKSPMSISKSPVSPLAIPSPLATSTPILSPVIVKLLDPETIVKPVETETIVKPVATETIKTEQAIIKPQPAITAIEDEKEEAAPNNVEMDLTSIALGSTTSVNPKPSLFAVPESVKTAATETPTSSTAFNKGTTFTSFGAFNTSTPSKSPTIASFGAQASSLFPSSSNPFAAGLNSANATTGTAGAPTFGQTSFTTPQTPTSQAPIFGHNSAASPFSNPVALKPSIATTGFSGFSSPSVVNFAALAEKDDSSAPSESKKKEMPSSFTQFRG